MEITYMLSVTKMCTVFRVLIVLANNMANIRDGTRLFRPIINNLAAVQIGANID